MKEKFDFPVFTATLVQPGIVNIGFKKVKKVTMDDLREMIVALKELGDGKKVGVFLTFQGFLGPDDGVMADSGRKEIQKYVFATAYVVKSIGIRLGIKLFINFHGANEGIPRNIFKTKQKAISWLTEIEEKQKAKKLVH